MNSMSFIRHKVFPFGIFDLNEILKGKGYKRGKLHYSFCEYVDCIAVLKESRGCVSKGRGLMRQKVHHIRLFDISSQSRQD